MLSEEVLAVINCAVLSLRNIIEIESCYLEHLACAFTVTGCDQRCVDIDEALLLEVLVDRVGDQGTHTEYSLEGVGTRTKVRDRTKVFEGVTLFLERVIRAGSAFNDNFCRLDLERLLCLRCCNESTFYDNGSADI